MFMISTALQTHLLTSDDLAAALNGLVFKFYGSATSQSAADALVPSSADAEIGSATLLCTISVDGDGTGVAFDTAPVSGAIYKDSSETWLGENSSSGYASFYRLESSSDTGDESTTDIRCQGSLGTLLADIIIKDTYLVAGEEQRIDNYGIGLPKSAS